ncbi:tripartite tricarboxylate transporter permease [Ornithinibacillus halophilus]|uniref:Putative tricarboxylic transport membrane protein n=1 Tax=Ornithinibacillus halophilus TaxID=930117 RepID=A0A1M5HIQ7_9BACI|nr:tripartite tricarboxylate transporter permease [Ornithinibacillus halophilus]SHG15825.1 putative tricarboxylic transport membrane protein [Ornithinibacillus halophilus]
MIDGLLLGFENLFQPIPLLILFAATMIGFLGGALPGISGTMLVIILLPISYGLDAIPAFILLTTIYASSVFSGLISAILFRTPGTPEAVATVLDGYPMAAKGKPGQALGIGILSSVTGGIFGTLCLIFLTPVLAAFALNFSSPEYFSLAVLGLTVVVSLSGGDLIKGFIGVALGLFIATVGMDPLTGTERFTFDSLELLSGIDLIPVLIGLFAVSEVLRKSKEDHTIKQQMQKFKTKIFDSKIVNQIKGTIFRSSILGISIGILPGVGATTAAMVSYSEATRWSKNKKDFGTGVPEGIAAPESANNAAAMGAMVPLLSLGIPGSATTAVILGAFVMHGLQPGPMLINNSPGLVYTIFISLLLVNILILVFSKPFIGIFSKIMKVPYYTLGPAIIIFCIIGTFAVRNSIFDIWIMLLFGLIGFYLDKMKFPLAAVILGLVLGPIAEEEFRRGLQMANGDLSIFFTRPISAILLGLALIALIVPLVNNFRKKKKA